MPTTPFLQSLAGTWAGTSTLHLSWLPDPQNVQSSESTLTIALPSNQAYTTLHYTWQQEGESQTGTIILTLDPENNQSHAAWLDSWHMPFPFMDCTGTADPVSFTGSYSGGEETWHWRIELEISDEDVLLLQMTNITPDGQEEWAVRAEYVKSSPASAPI